MLKGGHKCSEILNIVFQVSPDFPRKFAGSRTFCRPVGCQWNFFGLLQLAPPTGRCALAELLEQAGPWGNLEEVVDGAEANGDSERPKIKNGLVGCNERLSRADCGNRRRFGIAVGEGGSLPLKFA